MKMKSKTVIITGTLLEVGKVLGLLWLIIAVAVGIVCCVATYKSNQKYFQ